MHMKMDVQSMAACKRNMSFSSRKWTFRMFKICTYAHENGCKWGETTCESAACKGHLEYAYDLIFIIPFNISNTNFNYSK